jgi:putative FmdB family regulatory protein
VPIYEYLCEDCAYKFEVKQSMKDDPLATCERCGKQVQRLISSPAIMFKGSGWYITDYSDKMKPPTEGKKEGEKSDAPGGEKKDSTTSSTSPAAPAPAAAAPAAPASTSASPTSGSPAASPSPSSTPSSSDK